MGAVINKTEGGAFLISSFETKEVFFPEKLSEEQRLIAKTAHQFVQNEVIPKSDVIDHHGYEEVESLLKKAGELGLLAHSVPEAYGGLGLDKVTKGIVGEAVGASGSYGVAHSNQTCIATLPVTYFGTKTQKAYYLPKLASGEFLGAYCLTEPSAGSDALNSKTTAVLNEEGTHYLLNGTKQWITNAGFSDTFVVYAKIDGRAFTAFMVEKGTPGLSLGPEEKKLRINGSSTRSVIFDNCPVPVENIFGEIGRGHVIALNCLNLGRYNLGFANLGGAKLALRTAICYTTEREQFTKRLAHFHLTQEKLTDMAIRIFASEAIQYRTGGLLEEKLGALKTTDDLQENAKALSEHAIECAICKVFSSETLDQVVDEALQLHGGYGFMKDYAIENMYRDSRINRIFEGTNEINRFLIPNFIMKKGELLRPFVKVAFVTFGQKVTSEGDSLNYKVNALKRLTLVGFGLAFNCFGPSINEEQETLIRLANLVISVYAGESASLRALYTEREDHNQLVSLLLNTLWSESVGILKELIVNLSPIDQIDQWLEKLRKEETAYSHYPSFKAKRELALKLIEKGQYCF